MRSPVRWPRLPMLALASLAPMALAIDFPDLDMPDIDMPDHIPHMPDLPTGSVSMSDVPQTPDDSEDVSKHCSPQNLARYPSGWPAKLDYGIYWFGPNGDFKKAEKRQSVKMFNPTSWFDHPFSDRDIYHNASQRFANEYYDPSRKTVLYFHGWSGTGAFSTKGCKRVTSTCASDLCPHGGGHELAKEWLAKGWNVGFFYWDQFADEPCMRDAEQKIWFDRKGNGLKWASYDASTNHFEWKNYEEEAMSITDLCASSVMEAMGDFYSGKTVRFVGRSIGAQLAVGCAAKLHEIRHVAAPQRMALLDPLFTQKEFSFLGTGIRCGKITSSTGIGEFAAEATANYVKQLWLLRKVVTEVYTSNDEASGLAGDSRANKDMNTYAVQVSFKPGWCTAHSDTDEGEMACKHRAVFPLYFLSYGAKPPVLVASDLEGRTLTGSTKRCEVPSASCSDSEIRALVEEHSRRALEREEKRLPSVRQLWEQIDGTETFKLSDDSFAVSDANVLATITPDPAIEEEVATSNAMGQRFWGIGRAWHLGPHAGMSNDVLRVGVECFGAVVSCSFVAAITYLVGRRILERRAEAMETTDCSEDSSAEEDERSSFGYSPKASSHLNGDDGKQALLNNCPV